MIYGYSSEETETDYIGRVFMLDPVKQILTVEMSKTEPETRVLDLEHGKYTEMEVDFPDLQQLADFLVVEGHIEAGSEIFYFRELEMKDLDTSK